MMKNGSSGSSNSVAGCNVLTASVVDKQDSAPELTEEELETQYRAYKAQFEEWIQKNKNHPDRDAYNRYVNQFKEWEAQVETNRNAIRLWKARHEVKEDDADVEKPYEIKEGASSKKSQKTKSKKTRTEEPNETMVTTTNNEDMMASMMNMMSSASTSGPQPAAPVEPLGMMMAMTMMMPMMMMMSGMSATSSPMSQSSVTVTPDIAEVEPASTVRRPSPVSQEQVSRDRMIRSERTREWERGVSPTASRAAGVDQSALPPRRWRNDRESQADSHGDYWYQRWLASKQEQRQIPASPWIQEPPPFSQLRTFPRSYSPSSPWPPSSMPAVPDERVLYKRAQRNNFGARDFTMKKQSRFQE